MKIEKISLENYRFFQTKQEFSFESKNILLYGENGSGKSSLFNGIQKFFKYYQDVGKSKTDIKEAQNIFVEQKPKITIQIDDNVIEFDENGLTDDALKTAIENTGKTKLFLTYKDIYNINAIFQDDITYKEFKNIFVTLYHKELFDLFEEFEENNNETLEYITENDKEIIENVTILKEQLEQFSMDWDDELEPIIKEDDEGDTIPFIYDTAYYLSDDDISRISAFRSNIENYLDFNKVIGEIDDFNTSDILDRFDEIIEELNRYTLASDRYDEKLDANELIIVNKELVENHSKIEELLEYLEIINELAIPISKCYYLATTINQTINVKLNSFVDKINEILGLLQTNLEIKNIPSREYILFNYDFLHKKEVYNIDFEIEYAGKKLDNHSQNLNEAKMSALNSAIYFSSVLEKKPDIPILVLDDLMISLDMSNRNKMLEFLLDKTNFDENYQILIFTHDRAFYEMAKRKLDRKELGKWKYFEMFLDTKEKNGSLEELPFVKEFNQPSGYKELAELHLKQREYPPTANYLRKEVEMLIDKYLQLDNLNEKMTLAKLKNNNEHVRKFAKESQDIIVQLEKFKNISSMPDNIRIEKCQLFAGKLTNLLEKNKYIVDNFKLEENEMLDRVHFALKDILHPQSHHDLTKPLYKQELEDALAILKEFKEQVDEIDLYNPSDKDSYGER